MNLGLSKRGDYVVRSAICLARAYDSNAPKKLREISAEMTVPRTFVSQILGDLARAGLAVSSFGKGGGYRLSRPPSEVSLLEVVEAAEGALVPDRCVLGDGPGRWDAVCPLHEAWCAASAALREVLASTSLEQVARIDSAIETGSYPIPADAHRRHESAVAVNDSVQVELPAATVASRLRVGGKWLVPHVETAWDAADSLRVRVGPGAHAWLGKAVTIDFGAPSGPDDSLVLPFRWEATGPAGLFPRLDGKLHLCPVDAERCQLRLTAHYRPPGGRVGQAIDDAMLFHVARATIRSFVRRVARTLEAATAPAAGDEERRDPYGHGIEAPAHPAKLTGTEPAGAQA